MIPKKKPASKQSPLQAYRSFSSLPFKFIFTKASFQLFYTRAKFLKQVQQNNNKMATSTSYFPEPVRPLDSDCCGQGCTPCVNDIYEQELTIWRKTKNQVANKNARTMSPDEYCTCEMTHEQSLTSETKIYTFTFKEDQILHCNPAQHLILRHETKTKNKYMTRDRKSVV